MPSPPHPLLLDTSDTLNEIFEHPRVLILVNRGYSKAAAKRSLDTLMDALAVLTHPPPCYIVDDSSSQVPALTFMEVLGVSSEDPFVVILESYKNSRRKWLMERGKFSKENLISFVEKQGSKAIKPALLGQARPVGDVCATCPTLVEVVSDTFSELVLPPKIHVLLHLHKRTCDACKAFAPRYRMFSQLCARKVPQLRVAAMDAGSNDVDVDTVPESYTPVFRYFPGRPSTDDGGGNCKSSFLLDTRVFSESSKQVRITLPTLPQLLHFVQQHSGGVLSVPEDAFAEAAVLEEEAAALESAYDQLLEYVKLWKAFSEVSVGGGGKVGEQLKGLIVSCYNFIVKEAAQGDSQKVWDKLDVIAAHVESNAVTKTVSKATLELEAKQDENINK